MSETTLDAAPEAAGPPPCPVKVIALDIEEFPEQISAAHPNGGLYEGLWILVRAGGLPRKFLKLRFDGDVMTRAELAPLLADLGDAANGVAPILMPEHPPFVSLVVSTMFAREQELAECLESVTRLEYPSFETLVVDNRRGDDDVPAEWVERFPWVRFLREHHPGSSAARNCGLHAATGPIVAFTDDDVVIHPAWLAAMTRRFEQHPDEVAVSGMVIPRNLETIAQVEIEEYYGRYGLRTVEPVSHRLVRRGRPRLLSPATVQAINNDGEVVNSFSLYEGGMFGGGNNMAFRTDALRDLGGFDTRLGPGTPTHGGEDIAVFSRLAWRGSSVGYEPAALVFHVHRRDGAALRRQIQGYGVGFTAVATALVMEDPRHLGAMAATVPRAARKLGGSFWKKLREPKADHGHDDHISSGGTASLARLELAGMARGPFAYLQSWRRARKSRSR